jgi:hypothetical protein
VRSGARRASRRAGFSPVAGNTRRVKIAESSKAPIRKTAAQLMRSLEKGGFFFRSFEVEEVGDYAVDDADWNYKDVTHVTYVHHQFEGFPSSVSDDIITMFFMQKLGPFVLPLTTTLYISEPDRQTYHTSFGPVMLVIETVWRSIGEQRTSVKTTYSVGMGNRVVLNLVFPVVRRLVSRNNASLMEQDLDMRRRRGELRKRDYTFERIGPGTYAYLPTMRIADDHVFAPPPTIGDVRAPLATLPTETLLHLGDDAAYGIQVRRNGSQLELYPRLCPHEGACLDSERPRAERVHCPWHGRAFRATTLPLDSSSSVVVGGMTVRIDGESLVASPTTATVYADFDIPKHAFEEPVDVPVN